MITKKKEVALKNGQTVVLRTPEEADANTFLDYMRITYDETYFMSRYPEEVKASEVEEEHVISRIREAERDFMIGAYVDGEMIGNAAVQEIGPHIKYRHRAGFGMSIKKKYWNMGLGKILIREALAEAKALGYEQVELGVYSDNVRAKHLYEITGFETVGIQPRAFKLKDGTYRDEIMMVYQFH